LKDLLLHFVDISPLWGTPENEDGKGVLPIPSIFPEASFCPIPPFGTFHRDWRRRMKKSDHPDGKRVQPKLTPEVFKFIQSMGVYFESYGISRIGGLMLGLLMVAHDPLTAEEIASILKVSRASVSTNFPILLTSGLASKIAMHGDRATYYIFPDTVWVQAMQVSIQSIVTLKQLAEQGLQALSPRDSVRSRLVKTIEYADMQVEYSQKMLAEWRSHQQQTVRLAASSKSN